MLHALFKYLEVVKKYDYHRLLGKWMQQIANQLDQKGRGAGEAGEQKGHPAEVLAVVLNQVAKELGDKKPLTEHPLFAEQKGTFLDDYTLKATDFLHDKDEDWADVLSRKRTNVLLLPPHEMGPDLFGLLSCLPEKASFQDHPVIPLTAGVKIKSSPRGLAAAYRANYLTTDLWAAFTRVDGAVVQRAEEKRKKALSLLEETFGGARRAVRISFTYRPLAMGDAPPRETHPKDDQLHIKFDFHHSAFENVLRQHPDLAKYETRSQQL